MNFNELKKYLYPSIIGFLLLFFIYREYVHYRAYSKSVEQSDELKSDLNLLAKIFMSYHNIVSSNDCPQFDISGLSTVINWEFLSGYYYTTWFVSMIHLFSCVSLMVYEIRYLHPMIIPKYEKAYFMYLHKVTPLSSIIFYTILLFYGSVAWCNLLNRRLYIIRCVLLIFRWHFIYNPLARWVHNSERIIRFYIMPYYNSWSDFISEKGLDYKYYFWLIKKGYGVDDIHGVLNYSLTTICWFYFLYPFYYYIYYGFSNCSVAASKSPISSGSSDTESEIGYEVLFQHIMHIYNQTIGFDESPPFNATNDAAVDRMPQQECYNMTSEESTSWMSSLATDDTYTYSMEVFVNNMCIHACILIVFYHACRVIGFGSPGVRIYTDWNNPNVCKANCANDDSIPTSSEERAKKILSRMYSLLTSKNIQGILLAGIGVNSVLVLLRILWFLNYTSCLTWYGWLVTWMFLHMHIILPLNTLTLVVLITDKVDVRSQSKRKFVDSLVEYMLLKHEPLSEDAGEDAKQHWKLLEKFYQFYGSEYYEYLLDLSIRNLIFRNNTVAVEAKEEGEQEENTDDINPALRANVEHLLNEGLNDLLLNE